MGVLNRIREVLTGDRSLRRCEKIPYSIYAGYGRGLTLTRAPRMGRAEEELRYKSGRAKVRLSFLA